MKYIGFYTHIVMILFIGMLYSTPKEINFYADSWALLIGINEYQFDIWFPLIHFVSLSLNPIPLDGSYGLESYFLLCI